jgi:putative ABC transport system permease protein
MGCIILLLALILHETSFNRFIPDNRNVYRIVFGQTGFTQYPLAEKMKEEFPEVKDFFRFYQTNEIKLRNRNNELVKDKYFGFADPSLFKIMDIRFISGNAASSISEIAISEKTALKYFGNLSPLGAVLVIELPDGFTNLSVSGVFKNIPATSTLYPEFIADIKLSDKMFRQFQKQLGDYGNENNTSLTWSNSEFLSYVVLDKNTDIEKLTDKMEKYKEIIKNEKFKDLKYSMQPVSDIYLKSQGLDGARFWRQGNANELKYYEAISLLILLISVINYILLNRASTAERLRELGTRKVFGASVFSIRKQIILESNLVAVLSLIPAYIVIDYGMTFINETLDKTLSIEIFSNPLMWLILVSVVFFTGTLSGVLIGYNFSRIPAIRMLSGKASDSGKPSRWNYSFLIFHFSIFVLLMVSVITLTKQIKYSMTNFIGINPDDILICELNSPELKASFTTLCDEMGKIPGVKKTAGSSFIPPLGAYLPINLANPEGEKVRFDGLIMGEGMTELLGIEINEGTSFGPYQSSSHGVLLNESGAQKYNLKAGDNYLGFNIRGIVKDFHAHSLHTLIQPMVILQQNPAKMGLLAVKTDGTNDKAIIIRLREMYAQIAPNEIFEVRYLTDQISDFYENEKNQSKIIGAFSLLATVLSIMGLFGIALISISKKTKEIGIRKVNGSSISEILLLLNIDFIKWVLGAIVISIPVSVYIMSVWLKRFAYKTELSWWIFAAAGSLAIMIALLTVSWQSWKAATKNPVEALRYE